MVNKTDIVYITKSKQSINQSNISQFSFCATRMGQVTVSTAKVIESNLVSVIEDDDDEEAEKVIVYYLY